MILQKKVRYGMNKKESLKCSVGFDIGSSSIRINKGAVYLNIVDGVEYQLIEFIDPNQSLFKNLRTNKHILMSIHDFNNIISSENTNTNVSSASIRDDAWDNAQFKYEAIQPLLVLNSSYIGTKGLEKRAEECGVTSRTLRNWLQAFKSTGSIRSLLERKRGWSTGKIRLDDTSDQLIKEIINSFFLQREAYSIEELIREVHKQCTDRNLKKPSKNAVRLRVNQMLKKQDSKLAEFDTGIDKHQEIINNKEERFAKNINIYRDIQ